MNSLNNLRTNFSARCLVGARTRFILAVGIVDIAVGAQTLLGIFNPSADNTIAHWLSLIVEVVGLKEVAVETGAAIQVGSMGAVMGVDVDKVKRLLVEVTVDVKVLVEVTASLIVKGTA
jgi:hypothetical protein